MSPEEKAQFLEEYSVSILNRKVMLNSAFTFYNLLLVLTKY